jgi:hypothetical protein
VEFVRAWVAGYGKPAEMVKYLYKRKGPGIGITTTIIRGLLNSLLMYLPLFLLGRQPSYHGYIPFMPNEKYFLFLAIIVPFYFLLQTFILSLIIYLVLKALKKKAALYHLFNIAGMVGLIVGAVLICWDWVWVAMNSTNYVLLGISHLIIDVWAICLTVLAYKKILNISYGLGIALNILWLALGLPMAMLIMRAPL